MSHEFMNFILALAIIIVAAKVSGYTTTRLGQPSVLGELLAGLLLGPTLLNMFHAWPVFQGDEFLAESVATVAELGVILLMLLAGLELNLSELLQASKVATLAGVLGVILPLTLGSATAYLFGANFDESIMMGLTLSATSVSISAQTLMELNVLRSRVGLALLGAAVFDDILVILLLSLSLIVVGEAAGGIGGFMFIILRMLGYLIGAVAAGLWLLPRLSIWINRLPINQGTIAFVLVVGLLYAWTAEVLGGVAAITGAFLVGLFLGRTPLRESLESSISTLAYGLFVPVFFVNIGLDVNMWAISGSAWWFAFALTGVAIITKIAGCGLGAYLGGLSRRESLQLGVGMVSRGEVGLIVASFALAEALISQANFSIVIFMVIIATLLTPPMLRVVFASRFGSTTIQQELIP